MSDNMTDEALPLDDVMGRLTALRDHLLGMDSGSGEAALLTDALATISERDARVAVLVEALTECADEGEPWIEGHYKNTMDYPSELRRYNRDIEPFKKARALLASLPTAARDVTADLASDLARETILKERARADALQERLSELEKSQRTPGTVEVCATCAANQGEDGLVDWRNCPQPKCPIRQGQGATL